MSVSLLRIDDRLVHGQVVEGWIKSLRVNHIVVASDVVAADDTQMALYMLAVPYGVQLNCLTVAQAARRRFGREIVGIPIKCWCWSQPLRMRCDYSKAVRR
jgi:mannose/fructose/N-acetylgalactosamine-specific phosphotransferase system component IIB